jgi:hypothetical protein
MGIVLNNHGLVIRSIEVTYLDKEYSLYEVFNALGNRIVVGLLYLNKGGQIATAGHES